MPTSETPTRPAELGATFRSARLGAGVSVRDMAKRAGITHATLSLWERGDRAIAEDTYQRLMDALADVLAGAA